MADLSVTTDGELMVAHVEAETEAGTDFVDGYAGSPDFLAIDSGRIIIRQVDLPDPLTSAERLGLAVEEA